MDQLGPVHRERLARQRRRGRAVGRLHVDTRCRPGRVVEVVPAGQQHLVTDVEAGAERLLARRVVQAQLADRGVREVGDHRVGNAERPLRVSCEPVDPDRRSARQAGRRVVDVRGDDRVLDRANRAPTHWGVASRSPPPVPAPDSRMAAMRASAMRSRSPGSLSSRCARRVRQRRNLDQAGSRAGIVAVRNELSEIGTQHRSHRADHLTDPTAHGLGEHHAALVRLPGHDDIGAVGGRVRVATEVDRDEQVGGQVVRRAARQRQVGVRIVRTTV